MSKAATFLAMPSRERGLIVAAGLWLTAIRAGLMLLPFGAVRRALQAAGCRFRPSGRVSAGQVVRAVHLASRYVPGAACLPQALTANLLLQRYGLPSRVKVGLALEDGSLKGHAWIDTEGAEFLAGPDASRYTLLPSWDADLQPRGL